MIKEKLIKLRRSNFVHNVLILLFKFTSKFPTKKNVIIFESFLGKQYSDSPKAIYLYLKENYPKYKMYWSVDRGMKHHFRGKGITAVPRFGFKWIMLMSRAEYWVSNSRLPLWIPKPKGTTYIQTWHGTPLKRLAVDMDEVHMPGTDTEKYKKNFVSESAKWDYLISPNRYSTEIFKRAFQFNKTVIESGYPRNDILVNANNETSIQLIKEQASIPLDKKVILYAPTWRDNDYHAIGKYKFSLKMDLAQMKEELGDEYVILLRLHYLVAENLQLNGYESFVYNMSNYEDINKLYLISDILITDYSSVFFDYGILNRPMIFFTYDIEEYRDQLRGFYFDFENEAPGPLVYSTEEIIKELKNISANPNETHKNMQKFHEKFCYLEDGNATKRVIEKIFL